MLRSILVFLNLFLFLTIAHHQPVVSCIVLLLLKLKSAADVTCRYIRNRCNRNRCKRNQRNRHCWKRNYCNRKRRWFAAQAHVGWWLERTASCSTGSGRHPRFRMWLPWRCLLLMKYQACMFYCMMQVKRGFGHLAGHLVLLPLSQNKQANVSDNNLLIYNTPAKTHSHNKDKTTSTEPQHSQSRRKGWCTGVHRGEGSQKIVSKDKSWSMIEKSPEM